MVNANKKPSILLVEDNPDDVRLTLEAFKKSNVDIDVDVARDGVEALDYLFEESQISQKKLKHNPTVVILDLKLPKMDGLEVLRRLRDDDRTHQLPVVILTTSDEVEDRMKGYALGANSFVRKPVDFYQFVEAARKLGDYWSRINIRPPCSA